MYLSFQPAVLVDFGRESLQAHLSYVNVRYALPISGWSVTINPFTPFRIEEGGLVVEDYSDGQITLTIQQPITHLYGMRSPDTGCYPPMDAPMPEGCEVQRSDLNIPATIRIQLPIPREGLDCTHDAAMQDPACG